jgi:hypothetical protein
MFEHTFELCAPTVPDVWYMATCAVGAAVEFHAPLSSSKALLRPVNRRLTFAAFRSAQYTQLFAPFGIWPWVISESRIHRHISSLYSWLQMNTTITKYCWLYQTCHDTLCYANSVNSCKQTTGMYRGENSCIAVNFRCSSRCTVLRCRTLLIPLSLYSLWVVVPLIPLSASHQLLVPRCRLSTMGDRACPVVGATVWNCLPPDVTSSSSLIISCSLLMTFLFNSYPGAFVLFRCRLIYCSFSLSCIRIDLNHFRHGKWSKLKSNSNNTHTEYQA